MIPTDGRDHFADAQESFLGDSVGHWEGDTLIIEAINFVEDTWLIDDGAFHTGELKVTEILRMVDGKLEHQATVVDPAVLKEPFAMRKRTLKLTDTPMNEQFPALKWISITWLTDRLTTTLAKRFTMKVLLLDLEFQST